MARPKKLAKDRKQIVTVCIEPIILEQHRNLATKYNRSLSYWTEAAIKHYVEFCKNHPLL